METKVFGWTGIQVPTVGQGTWRMGGSAKGRKRDIDALRLGLDLGLTHIDTAEMYGPAEGTVAAAIKGRNRSRLFVVSKVLPEHASYRGTIRAAEASLRRLGTDYLDLYLLHLPSSHPIGETMGAMEELVRTGKIRFIGVSNFDCDEMRGAMAALTRERLVCNQVLYHLGARGIERALIPFCDREEIAVVGYTPFGSGHFSGRTTQGRILQEIGAHHGKTPRQVALRFLTQTPGTFAIPKASDVEHVRENAGATGFALTPADLKAIDRAFPPASPARIAVNTA